MYRRRSYYKRSYAPRKKYSNETSSFSNTASATGENISVNVPLLVNSDHPMQGMRKIKNLKLSLNFSEIHSSVTEEYTKNPIYWALVYVPQGTQPQALNVTDAAASFYEPNQNVIMQGIQTSDNETKTYSTRLARNLNSGDSIYLCVASKYLHTITAEEVIQTVVSALLNYAVTF